MPNFRIRISNGMLILNTILLFATGIVIILVNATGTSSSMEGLGDSLMKELGNTVIERSLAYLSPAERAIREGSYLIWNGVLDPGGEAEGLLAFFREQLLANPEFKMVYYADTEGNLVMARRMPDGSFTKRYVRRLADHVQIRWKHDNPAYYGDFPDADDSLEKGYDPRKRVWYSTAVGKRDIAWTDVYIFATDRQPGFTCAMPLYKKDGALQGVMAVDIGVLELSRFLGGLAITPGSSAFIVDSKDNIVALQLRKDDDAGLLMRETTAADGSKSYALLAAREAGIALLPALLDASAKPSARGIAGFSMEGTAYNAFVAPLSTDRGLDLRALIAVPESDIMGVAWRNNLISVLFSSFMIVVAIAASIFLSRAISHPMRALSEEMGKIKDFDLRPTVDIRTILYEIDDMQNSFKGMKSGLLNFRKYVPADLVAELVRQKKDANIGGEKKRLTIFFTDIAGFTGISERLTPEELVADLCEYFNVMGGTVLQHQGTLDKYIGDSVMAFWGAPRELDKPEESACSAAIDCRDRLASLFRQWENKGKAPFRTRFGINTGDAIVGNMGSSERINYTVLGDPVNLASRLEGLNKAYGTEILVSQATRSAVEETFEFRRVDRVKVVGKNEPIDVSELLTRKGDINPSLKKLYGAFDEGFAFYLEREWQKAIGRFAIVLKYRPHDGPSRALSDRCMAYETSPPPPDWDGSFVIKEK